MHFNIRSLSKNVDKLHEFLTDLKTRPAVIAISETKLKESKIANNINLQGYNFIHYDSKTSAVGVGLYINKLLVYSCRNDLRLNLDRVEDLWIEITVNNKPYVVGVIYRHPACSMAELDTFSKSVYDTLHNLNLKKTNFCILGDFNIDLSRIREYNNTRKYADNLLSCSVKCVIDQPTRVTAHSKTLLDHIYVNSRQQNVSGGIAVSDISDHFPTFAVIEIKAGQKKQTDQIFTRDLKNFNVEAFLQELNSNFTDLQITDGASMHQQFDKFVNDFTEIVNTHAPLKRATRREKRLISKPWLTKGLLKSIKSKNKIFSRLHKTYDRHLEAEFKTYRNTLNRAIKCAKQNYYKNYIELNKNSFDKIWKIIDEMVNVKNKCKKTPTKLVITEEIILTEPKAISNAMNDSFVSIGRKMTDAIPDVHSSVLTPPPVISMKNSIFLQPTTSDEVETVINALKNNKAIRIMDVETKFIKLSKNILSPVLSDLFNVCIAQGVFPDCLKIAEVIPIFKKGDHNLATNYRPISILSQFDKIFEKLIYIRISSYLEKYDLLSKNQFGFRENSSTNFAIAHIHDNILRNVDLGLRTCCIFLDFSKAFGTVNHQILLAKLQKYFGIRGKPLDLFKSYSSNRYQYTKILQTQSELMSVSCGVPQGSCLGPLLFLMYINPYLPRIIFFKEIYFFLICLLVCIMLNS